MGKRGAKFIILAHCPVQRSSNTMSSMRCPPRSPGPWHVGVESQTLCLFSRNHLKRSVEFCCYFPVLPSKGLLNRSVT